MSSEAILTSAIKADTVLMQRVKHNLYPDFSRQETLLPGIAYIRTDTEFFHTIHEPRLESRAGFEVYVMAESRTESIQLGAQFEYAMARAGLYINNRRSEFDAEQGIYSTVFHITVFTTSQ